MNESQEQAEKLKRIIRDETQVIFEKLKLDAKNKVIHECDQLAVRLNTGLVDEVVKQARKKISENQDYQRNTTEKLVAQIER